LTTVARGVHPAERLLVRVCLWHVGGRERSEIEARVRATFDAVAEGYDHPLASWFDRTAQAITDEAALAPGMEVLDLATGTGKVALALAASEPSARVLGVDLSPRMLAQAERKARALGLPNVAFTQSSFDQLNYGPRFDLATCSFGVFFVPHMAETLARFAAQVRPGGRVVLSTFCLGSFSPFNDVFFQLYREFGFETPTPPWITIATQQAFAALFREAGLPHVRVTEHDFGFDLADEHAWWDIVYNAAYRGHLQRLTQHDAPSFKERHLDAVSSLMQQGQRRLDVRVMIAVGTK